MAVWHEVKSIQGSLGQNSRSWRSQLVIQRDEDNPHQFRAFFRRWQSGEGTRTYRGEHGSWYRLTPIDPLIGEESDELRRRLLPLLERVDAYECDSLFRIEIEHSPARPPIVAKFEHPRYDLRATVLRHGANRFEILYWGEIVESQEFGWGFCPELYPADDPRRELLWSTFTDNIESAHSVAAAEMENIIQINPIFKRREDQEVF